jgi:hypothetical protein
LNLLPAARDNHNRKFKSLAFMDAHNTDNILIFAQYFSASEVAPAAFYSIYEIYKVKQTLITGFFKPARIFEQSLRFAWRCSPEGIAATIP